jgi:hypothetical protein
MSNDKNEETHEFESFSFREPLGNYYVPLCQNKDKFEISKLARELGVGPSMFLISIKKLALFFFIMTIINIPVYVFLYGRNNILKSNF